MKFDEKIALVTGGGTGIGRATAILLARQGARVLVAGRRMAPLEEVVAEIARQGGEATVCQADFAQAAEARGAVDRAVTTYGRLDLAVNAAGAAAVGTVVDSDEALFDRVVAANFRTAWLSLKFQIPAIASAGGGAIVNVASRAGLVGVPGGSIYSGAKHAVVGLTKSAAIEAGPLGIRINAVCPGQTRTAQFDGIVEQAMPGASSDDAAAMLGKKLPLGRIAAAEEVAAAIAWLLGPEASFITGAAVPVDGGGGAG